MFFIKLSYRRNLTQTSFPVPTIIGHGVHTTPLSSAFTPVRSPLEECCVRIQGHVIL